MFASLTENLESNIFGNMIFFNQAAHKIKFCIRRRRKTNFNFFKADFYKDINDPSSFISRLTCSEADALIASGNIGGGMLPKLNNCTDAIRKGVNNVHILDGRIPHCILLEIFTKKGVGTMFMADDDALAQNN